MDNISKLIKEAQPFYFKKKKQKARLKFASIIFVVSFVFGLGSFDSYADYLYYCEEEFEYIAGGSVIIDEGFAVDENGLLLVV